MTAFECYNLYVALKMHFNSKSYDFIKYNGKVKTTREAFEKRKDKFFFEKLAKHNDPKSFLIANLLVNPNGWIRDLAYGDNAKNIYEEWLKRKQSLSYIIQQEVLLLHEDFNSNFKVKNNQHPTIVKLYLGSRISLETLIALSDIVDCIHYWNKNMINDPLWKDISLKISKYLPFLNYDKEKVRKICLDTFS
jgi:hypothetical protein